MLNRFITYIQESRREIKRVNWPTRQETIRLTLLVIGISLTMSAFLGILDLFFRYLIEQFVL